MRNDKYLSAEEFSFLHMTFSCFLLTSFFRHNCPSSSDSLCDGSVGGSRARAETTQWIKAVLARDKWWLQQFLFLLDLMGATLFLWMPWVAVCLCFVLFVNVRFFELFLPQRLKLKKRIYPNISAFFCVHPQCVIYRAWYFPHCYSLCSWSFLIEVETTLAGIEYQFYIKDGDFVFPSLLDSFWNISSQQALGVESFGHTWSQWWTPRREWLCGGFCQHHFVTMTQSRVHRLRYCHPKYMSHLSS